MNAVLQNSVINKGYRLHTRLARQESFIQWCYEQSSKLSDNGM